ncbi:MAG TPA: 5-(carboxyamino)imidazole ribonucleotide synthase [Rhizomicrobium sp.]|jgi:5-(carboxyamino)imidazole ribonucleotide synthase
MIGILGGGQLGRMLALAAAQLGLKSHIYCDHDDAPAFEVAAAHSVAAYEDDAALLRFAEAVDVVTFEFENVPARALEILARVRPTRPDAAALAPTQDRLAEKEFVSSLGIATAPFARADSATDAHAALARIGAPALLKTRRFGYDGKGQAKISESDDLDRALEAIRHAPAILERVIDFAFECSVIAARGVDGSFAAYDPPENIHRDGILRRSQVPSRLTPAQCDEAQSINKSIAEALRFVGVLAVEFFVTNDGTLLVNEIAPRVHNSGHWTLEACTVSQFEQHIRAIAAWPLGDPARHSDAVMTNLIGEDAADWHALASAPGALHLYGKKEIRPGRKMGHLTRISAASGLLPGGAGRG